MTVRLPDFVIVGAMRSGSTSLYRALADHPEVFMAPGKEVRFFDRHHERGLDWYAAHFAGAAPAQVVGEASPDYLYVEGALDRLAATVPDVRILAILRDPAERAYSHFRMEAARGRERRPWADVVDAELGGEEGAGYLGRSRYGAMLARAVDTFGPERVAVVAFEHLRDDPVPTFRRVTDFLGIAAVAPASLGRQVNAYFRVRSPAVRRLAVRLPRRARNAVARLNQVEERYPPMDPAVRARIDAALAADRTLAVALAGWPEDPWAIR